MLLAGYALAYGSQSAHPCAFFNNDVFHYEVEGDFFVIVVTAEDKRSLRNAGISANAYLAKIVYPHAFSYPCIVAYLEKPGVLDIHARLDNHSPANVCPEKAQEEDLERGRSEQRVDEEAGIGAIPQQSLEQATGFVPGIIEFREVCLPHAGKVRHLAEGWKKDLLAEIRYVFR